MKYCLLTRYLELKKLPPDIRYYELKRWEADLELYLLNCKDNVISIFAVNHR